MNVKGFGGSLISSRMQQFYCTNHTKPSHEHNLMISHKNHSILLHRPGLLVQKFIPGMENQFESCTGICR